MASTSRKTAGPALLALGVVLLAINLRSALASVGPLVPDIRAATGLANPSIGLLTALPLLAFGLLSAFTSIVTRRLGIEGGVVLALSLVAAGTFARGIPPQALLFGGTILLGVGIAPGNVLLPALAKLYFLDRPGSLTSLYSSVMGLGATAAAGVSAPLAASFGWRVALSVWAVPALVALGVWIPLARRRRRLDTSAPGPSRLRALGGSGLAWQIALFMGLPPLTFYVLLAWMPDLRRSQGFGAAAAGGLLALSQAAGVLGTAAVPLWAGSMEDQRRIVWILGILEAGSLAGLFVGGGALAIASVAVLGFVLGGTFGLALLLLVLRTADAHTAGELSGMAQSIGYLIAAAGPTVFGLIHDLLGGWTVPLVFLAAVPVAKVGVGVGAGRPGCVLPMQGDPGPAPRTSPR